MINLAPIARPYAKAAFETAKKANQSSTWSLMLKQLSCIVQDADMKLVLDNPQLTKTQLSDFIISCLHKITGNGSENGFSLIENFIRILAEKKRLKLLPVISKLFEQDCATESGHLFLVVTSPYEMDAMMRKNTQEKLEKQFNLICEIEYQVDPSLIGGLLVRSEKWVL